MDRVIFKRKGLKEEHTIDAQVWDKNKAKYPQFVEIKRYTVPPEVIELEELKKREINRM